MIGGWYVFGTEHDGTYNRATLLAGPFNACDAAERAIATVRTRIDRYPKNGRTVDLTVCECYTPELYTGLLNAELWLTVTPVEKAK